MHPLGAVVTPASKVHAHDQILTPKGEVGLVTKVLGVAGRNPKDGNRRTDIHLHGGEVIETRIRNPIRKIPSFT